MSATPDKLVERYLKRLAVELGDVPRDRRSEIVDEIAVHIAEARAGLGHETEANVRNIVEGLGHPADIAADARERFDVQPAAPAPAYKPGWMEVAALVFLLVGGLILPVVGWLIGVVLLWVSNAWNVRDKLIGTLFVPGGLGLSILLLTLLLTASGGGSGCGPITNLNTGATTGQPCPDSGSSTNYLAVLGVLLIVVAPIITTAYLAYRLKRHPAAATA